MLGAGLSGAAAADVRIEADVAVTPGGWAGLTARQSGAGEGNYYLGQVVSVGGGRLVAQIYRRVGTTLTLLTQSAPMSDRVAQPPVPSLPEDVVRNTRAKYAEAYERLIGQPFDR